MIEDLNTHKRDREYLMLEYINKRLDKSFTSYTSDLCSSLDYLERRNSLNVVKKLNRMQR